MWRIFLLAVGYSIALTDTAYAYLDPGTGTIILQGLIAAAATGMFFMRSKLRSLLGLLKLKKKIHSEDERLDY
jgi:hypothetical protein